MGKYLEALEAREERNIYTVKSVKNNILLHPRAEEDGEFFLEMYGLRNPQNPQNSPLSYGPGALPDTLEAARTRLTQLEQLQGSAGACRAIWRASRRLERERLDFWRRANASERHTSAVCVALLDAEN